MSCDKVLEPETQIRDGVVMVAQFQIACSLISITRRVVLSLISANQG